MRHGKQAQFGLWNQIRRMRWRRKRSTAGAGAAGDAARTGWNNSMGEVRTAGWGIDELSALALTIARVPSVSVNGQVLREADFWQWFFCVCVLGQQGALAFSKGQAVAALVKEKPHSAMTNVKAVRILATWMR